MKIIVISSCYPCPQNINSGIFIHQQIKALQNLGVVCHVIQPINWFPPFGLHRFHSYWQSGFDQLKNSFDKFEDVKIHHPRVFRKLPSRFFLEHQWDMKGKAVAKYIRNHAQLCDADLIYAQFLIHEGYIGVLVKELTKIPLVSMALGDDVHAWPEQKKELVPFLKTVLHKSDLILANSLQLSKDTEKWADKERPIQVQTVYRGIDFNKFYPVPDLIGKEKIRKVLGLAITGKYLVCVARPVRSKGWTNLLDSIQLLREKFNGWTLLMVAPKHHSQETLDLQSEAEARGIETRLQLLQGIQHNQMPDLLRAADVYVLPSYNEGLSNSVLEAMATGLPVITTDVGGHNEFIKDHENGILIAPNDTQQLTDALEKIIVSKDLRVRLADRAREGALKIGSYLENAQKLLNIFEWIKSRPQSLDQNKP